MRSCLRRLKGVMTMKLKLSEEWYEKFVDGEPDSFCTAGDPELLLDQPPAPKKVVPLERRPEAADVTESSEDEEYEVALATLVVLKRREMQVTVAELAELAKVDPGEIWSIERDHGHRPKARTIHQLAGIFKIPSKALFALSGNLRATDAEFRERAVRFAAKSEELQVLSKPEKQALSEFVDYLAGLGDE